MRTIDAWVTGFVAVAVIGTAAIIYTATGTKWSIGSLGEWVSGLGSLGAVMVAVWVAGRQHGLAQTQFREEREHAAAMVAEAHRYQLELLDLQQRQSEEAQRVSDHRTAFYYLQAIVSALGVARRTLTTLQNADDDYAARARLVTKSRAFQYADQAAASFTSSTINNADLAQGISRVLHLWRRTATLFDAIATIERRWTKESVGTIKLDENIQEVVADAARLILLAEPHTNLSDEEAAEGGRTWAKSALPD